MMGQAALITWTDVEPAYEAEFNAWYNYEHVDDLIGLPDWRRGRRFRAVDGAFPYLAIYEAETLDAFASRAYLDLLANFSPWSRQSVGHLRKVRRVVYGRVGGGWRGMGGALASAVYVPEPGHEAEQREAATKIVDAAGAMPGCLGAVVLAADADITGAPYAKGDATRLNAEPWDPQEQMIIVQGMDRAAVEAAMSTVRRELGVRPDPSASGVYEFCYGCTG